MDRLPPSRRSWLMSRIRSKNTLPELTVRRLVFRLGYRFRLHAKYLPGQPDLVFAGRRKVIFVNGCFWHGHGCGMAKLPKSNVTFWRNKIERNRSRDVRSRRALARLGWQTLTVWECATRRLDLTRLQWRLIEFLEC